jgi:multidrug efflux pump subunit AcrB
MDQPNEKKHITREFGLTSFAVNNSTSIFILIGIIVIFGLLSYRSMPKEQFPEIVIPTVYINTPYPGNSPVDIENLVTRHIEKQLKAIKGVKKINSTSSQDISVIVIEFNENVKIGDALTDVKDAVDKAKKDLPSDLDNDPVVQEIDLTEIPIMSINLSGDFEISKLNEYAEWLQDELETLTEVSKVQITGSVDREIQVNADLYKMDARKVTFGDIETAIATENLTISGGDILTEGYRRSLRVSADLKSVKDLENIVIKAEDQSDVVYLKDVAEVKDSYVERQSFARLATNEFAIKGNYPVVSLRVIKRSGENLINADRKINTMLEDAKKSKLPSNLAIVVADNQADNMNTQIDNLENSIISGMILVVLVLMFFMGLRNALFVGIAIPLSMLLSFMVLNVSGNTINIMVLFSLILALGMLVDNAIVVIENTYRLKEQGFSNLRAAKEGAGEVAFPIISSTLTTLAAFLPLAFWGGVIGEFMKFMPITLIIVLSSSLVVGLIINPVVAARFMKVDRGKEQPAKKKLTILGLALLTLAIPSYFLFSTYTVANLLMLGAIIALLNAYFFKPAAYWFQNRLLTRIEFLYLRTLRFALRGKNPYGFFIGAFVLFVGSIAVFVANQPLVFLFPENEPNNIYVYAEAAQGTDVLTTDQYARDMEKQLFKLLEPYKDAVKFVITNVGKGTSDPTAGPVADFTPHKFKISVGFVKFNERNGVSTRQIMREISEATANIPGLVVTTDKENAGPPVGKPVNIEVTGDDYITLIEQAEIIKNKIDRSGIAGLDGLKLEVETGKPELLVEIDRDKARMLGLSTNILAMTLRTAIYGKEVSKFKDGDDDYPIQLRLADQYRYDISALNNQRITYRDNKGKFNQIPVSAVATFEYGTTFGAVKRKNLDRMIEVSANVVEGYNPNQIVEAIKDLLSNHEMPEGYAFKFTGEQEEQAESVAFLMQALLIAVCAIFMILVSQFNSTIKPFIIICQVLFSLIGVFLGMTFMKDDFIIIMTGVGIISLAGIVVNNAIVLIDYTDLVRQRRRQALGLPDDVHLPKEEFIDCLMEAGFARLRPVLLTAITTVLGLIPLAVGFNIDFFGLFSSFSPAIYWGGENADFWGPMAWTVVYGLTFTTFLTLVIVPVMYLISDDMVVFSKKIVGKKPQPEKQVEAEVVS